MATKKINGPELLFKGLEKRIAELEYRIPPSWMSWMEDRLYKMEVEMDEHVHHDKPQEPTLVERINEAVFPKAASPDWQQRSADTERDLAELRMTVASLEADKKYLVDQNHTLKIALGDVQGILDELKGD